MSKISMFKNLAKAVSKLFTKAAPASKSASKHVKVIKSYGASPAAKSPKVKTLGETKGGKAFLSLVGLGGAGMAASIGKKDYDAAKAKAAKAKAKAKASKTKTIIAAKKK